MDNVMLNPEHLVWFEKYVDLGYDRSLKSLAIVVGVEVKMLKKISKLENWSRMLDKHHFETVISHRKKRNGIKLLAKTMDITTGTCAKILQKSFQTDGIGNVLMDNNGEPILKDNLTPSSATEAAALMSTMATLAKTVAALDELDDNRQGREIDVKLLEEIENDDMTLFEKMRVFEKHNRPIPESLKIEARVIEIRSAEDHGEVNINIDMSE